MQNWIVAARAGTVEMNRGLKSYGEKDVRAERWLMQGCLWQKQPQDEVPTHQTAVARNGERAS